MSTWFIILTLIFIAVSVAMSLIILVQRPQGGGLSGAFGGAGGGGTDTAFGGRTGDALTVATVGAFVIYLGLALALNLVDTRPAAPLPEGPAGPAATGIDESGAETTPGQGIDPGTAVEGDAIDPVTSEAATEVLPPVDPTEAALPSADPAAVDPVSDAPATTPPTAPPTTPPTAPPTGDGAGAA